MPTMSKAHGLGLCHGALGSAKRSMKNAILRRKDEIK